MTTTSLLGAALLLSTAPVGDAAPQFRERPGAFVARDGTPLSVRTLCGSPDKDFIIEVNGGALALQDFDLDGDPDLVVVDGSTLERVAAGEPGRPPRFFANRGDGTFEEPGGPWAMEGRRWGMGCAAGDADGDGRPDLVITEWGPDRLLLNRAGGWREAEQPFEGSRWGTSAAFLDYDLDGNLDLVVVNYLAFRPEEIKSRTEGACRWKGHPVMCGPEGLAPVHDQLYRGNGDGTFADVTRKAGFQAKAAGFGLGAVTLDFDQDGDTDVYVANDSTPNHLWINGGGSFEEGALFADVALDGNGKEQAGMGIACGDVTGDGLPDLFVTNFSGESNTLYASRRRGKDGERVGYLDRTDRMGLGGASMVWLGWGTGMDDFDLDGDVDLFVLNGHVYPQADEPGTDTSYAQPSHFYRNPGGGGVFAQELLSDAPPRVMRAGAAADLDGDGDSDVVGYELDGEVRVYENRGGPGHWLRVRLSQEPAREGGPPALGNRFALGAAVTAHAGEARIAGEVRTAGGYQSAVPPEVMLPLGAREEVDEVRVRWPDGAVTRHAVSGVDRVVTLRRADGEPVEPGAAR